MANAQKNPTASATAVATTEVVLAVSGNSLWLCLPENLPREGVEVLDQKQVPTNLLQAVERLKAPIHLANRGDSVWEKTQKSPRKLFEFLFPVKKAK